MRGRRLGRGVAQALLCLLAFAVGTGIAELAGATNLGTAMTFGQIVFALALVAVLLRG